MAARGSTPDGRERGGPPSSAGPAPDVRRILLPKHGAPPSECEDSIAVDARAGRFAVADGATEGFGSREWSRLLTREWVRRACDDRDAETLVARARTMGDHVRRRWSSRTLSWFQQEKSEEGAFAAFLGLVIDGARWRAVALGDCCLFQERDGALERSFPATSSDFFTSRPTLVPSRHDRFEDVGPRVVRDAGDWTPGARLLLMSDAVAAWYFDHRTGVAGLALRSALQADDVDALAAIVDEERAARRMRNDDVAILSVRWPRR